MSFRLAIKFLLALNKSKNNLQQPIAQEINQDNFHLKFDVYEPVPGQSYKGTILFLHGMNYLGNKDKRIVNICQAASYCGFRAIAPSYPIIERCIVDMQSVDDFAQTIHSIADDKILCPKGKVAIFTASFSGALCLRAIRKNDVVNKVSSFCAVGVVYYVQTAISSILARKTVDYYAKLIAIKNLLRLAGELDSEFERGMDCLIMDSHTLQGWPSFEKDWVNYSKDTQQKLLTIQEAVISQRDLTAEYQDKIDNMGRIFMENADLSGVKCPVTLIHSVDDDVMPTIESELLHRDLKKYKLKSKMVLTPLLSHADLAIGLQHIIDLYLLISRFNYFLKHV